jgi:hypothetical protein
MGPKPEHAMALLVAYGFIDAMGRPVEPTEAEARHERLLNGEPA